MAMTPVPPEIDPEQRDRLASSHGNLHLVNDTMLKEEGVFASLWSNVRDVFFPVKLPPLELESKPIPVKDPMAFQRDPKSAAISAVIHVIIFGLIGYVVTKKIITVMAPAVKLTDISVPPPTAPKKDLMGGGGGQKGPTPVTKGNVPPKFAPPVPKIEMPRIPTPPTIDLQDVKMPTVAMPNLGDPRSPLVGVSMGNGSGGGIGSGNGGGLGAGSGGNMGGGIRHVGGGVSAPSVIHSVEPEFSEEARKAKFAGNVVVELVVDAQGKPQNVRVIKPVGMGLDEKAVEAVRQYLFKPAMEAGKPVPVQLSIEVDFQIF